MGAQQIGKSEPFPTKFIFRKGINMEETTNTQMLAQKLSFLLNSVSGYDLHCQMLPGIKLTDRNGQLIYSSGNQVKLAIYQGELPIVEIKTIDNFDKSGIVDDVKKIKHGLSVWLNRSTAQVNLRNYLQLPHDNRGYLLSCKYVKDLEQLARYTDACWHLNSQDLADAILDRLATRK